MYPLIGAVEPVEQLILGSAGSSVCQKESPMSKMIERCAGIDMGKRFLRCSVLTGAAHEDPASQTRRFDTNVPDLQRQFGIRVRPFPPAEFALPV